MPSREEIAELLNSAGRYIEKQSYTLNERAREHNITKVEKLNTLASEYYEYATQIENMRCENCNKVSDCVAYLVMGQDAKDFGCFSYKPKENTHE